MLNTPLAPTSSSSAVPQSAPEDVKLAIAINASIQIAIAEGVPVHEDQPVPGANDFNGWGTTSGNATHNGWGPPDEGVPVHEDQPIPGAIDWGTTSDNATYNGWGPPGERVPVHEDQPIRGANDFNGWGTTSGDAAHNGWGPPDGTPSKASTEPQLNEPGANPYNGWAEPEVRPSGPVPVVSPSVKVIPLAVALPTAPPLPEEEFYGPVQYPSIDNIPVDLTVPAWADKPGTSEAKEEGGSISGSCVICLDAPVEGACIPCGHVAGCMSCLKEIREKKWGCPVCRAKIDQVVKLYAV